MQIFHSLIPPITALCRSAKFGKVDFLDPIFYQPAHGRGNLWLQALQKTLAAFAALRDKLFNDKRTRQRFSFPFHFFLLFKMGMGTL